MNLSSNTYNQDGSNCFFCAGLVTQALFNFRRVDRRIGVQTIPALAGFISLKLLTFLNDWSDFRATPPILIHLIPFVKILSLSIDRFWFVQASELRGLSQLYLLQKH